MLEKLRNAMDNVKEENSMLRGELKDMENQFMAKEQEWLEAQDSLVFEVNNMKRKWSDSEQRFADSRYECQRL